MFLLDKKANVYRLSQTGYNKLGLSTYTTSLDVDIQPGKNQQEGTAGSWDKVYKIYLDADKDIKEGDEIRRSNEVYKVEAGGVELRTGFGADYLDLTCRRVK